jgi:hypothetical protein
VSNQIREVKPQRKREGGGKYPTFLHPFPPSDVEVKNEWVYTSTSPRVFMACTGLTSPSLFEAF